MYRDAIHKTTYLISKRRMQHLSIKPMWLRDCVQAGKLLDPHPQYSCSAFVQPQRLARLHIPHGLDPNEGLSREEGDVMLAVESSRETWLSGYHLCDKMAELVSDSDLYLRPKLPPTLINLNAFLGPPVPSPNPRPVVGGLEEARGRTRRATSSRPHPSTPSTTSATTQRQSPSHHP